MNESDSYRNREKIEKYFLKSEKREIGKITKWGNKKVQKNFFFF